jgi:hypothetical protein
MFSFGVHGNVGCSKYVIKYGENFVDLLIDVLRLKVNAGKYSTQSVVWLSQKLLMKAPNDLWTRSIIPFTFGEYGDTM